MEDLIHQKHKNKFMKEHMDTSFSQGLVFSTSRARLITLNIYSMTRDSDSTEIHLYISSCTSLKQKATAAGPHKCLLVRPLLMWETDPAVGCGENLSSDRV